MQTTYCVNSNTEKQSFENQLKNILEWQSQLLSLSWDTSSPHSNRSHWLTSPEIQNTLMKILVYSLGFIQSRSFDCGTKWLEQVQEIPQSD